MFTHLLHEEGYTYLRDAKRASKENETIVFSFLKSSDHWDIFEWMVSLVGTDQMSAHEHVVRAMGFPSGVSAEGIAGVSKPPVCRCHGLAMTLLTQGHYPEAVLNGEGRTQTKNCIQKAVDLGFCNGRKFPAAPCRDDLFHKGLCNLPLRRRRRLGAQTDNRHLS